MSKTADEVGVELVLLADGVNVVATAYDVHGNEMDMPAKIFLSPQFSLPAGHVNLLGLRLVSVDAGKIVAELSSEVIHISGKTGKIRVSPVDRKVVPTFLKHLADPPPSTSALTTKEKKET